VARNNKEWHLAEIKYSIKYYNFLKNEWERIEFIVMRSVYF